MGRRGPKPTPTALLESRGSWRAKERTDEPQVDPEIPPCPAWLSPRSRPYWDQISRQLYDLKVLTALDTTSLCLLADAIVDYIEAQAELETKGRTAVTQRGYAVSPEYRNYQHAGDRLLKLLREFGLTPSSRANVKVSDGAKKKENGKARFFQTSP